MVAQWYALASGARGPRFDPRSRRGKIRSPSVICRDDTRSVLRPSDQDVNWMSPVQGKSPLVQVKEPYGNLDMVTCRLSSCSATRSVQCTPADNARKRAPGS